MDHDFQGANGECALSAAPETDGEPISVRLYQGLDELESLVPLWDDLISHYPCASIFCTPEWLISWWRSHGKDRNLFVLAFFDSKLQLVALAPFSTSREQFLGSIRPLVIRLLGDGSRDSDNLDFPARAGFENMIAIKILEFLYANRKLWDMAVFNTMPTDSPVAGRLVDRLKLGQWTCLQDSCDRLTVFLPPTWDEYLKQISTKERRNLAYYGRRLEKQYSVFVYRCTHESQLAKCLDALFQMHQARWKQAGEPGSFADHVRREFYIELSQRLLARNRLELWILELDGKIAAAQFGMRYGTKVYSLQEGYDPAHVSDRVGFLLRGEVLRRLILEGIEIYDFLGGNDEHKARWRATLGSYQNVRFAPRWSKGAILLQSAHRMVTGKEWLRARLHPSAWRILHGANLALRGKKPGLTDSSREAP